MGEQKVHSKDIVAMIRDATESSRFQSIIAEGRVLVVDNSPTNLEATLDSFARFYLKHNLHVELYGTTKSSDAIEIVRNHSPSLAIIPKMKFERTSLPQKIREINNGVRVVEKPGSLDLALVSDVEFEYGKELSEYSTMKIGGLATCVATPGTREGLQAIIKLCSEHHVPYRRRGRGSNSIYGHLHGVLINSQAMSNILSVSCRGTKYTNLQEAEELIKSLSKGEEVFVEIEAGMSLPVLARMGVRYSLSGVEYAIGIPGTIGGAVVMNAGAGTDKPTMDKFEVANVVDPKGKIQIFPRDRLAPAHRYTRLQDPTYENHFVYSVVLRLTKGDQAKVEEDTERFSLARKPEPKEPSIGSMWRRRGYTREGDKDDPGATQWYADDLITTAGCNGWRSESGAVIIPPERQYVSFFLAPRRGILSTAPRATVYDVVELAKRIYDQVYRSQEVKLVLEGRFVGETNSGRSLYKVVQGVLNDKYSLAEVKDDLKI